MFVTDILFTIYDSISPFQAALATSLILFFLVYIFLKDNDLPPGPIGLPLLGYLPFLKSDTCHIQLKDMVQKYGDIFSFRVTGTLFIHLGSMKALKEAHVTKSECFAGRYTDYGVASFLFKDGLASTNGEPWKVLRKYFLMKFKEIGVNAVKVDSTGSLNDTLKDTVEELHETKGQPIAITDLAMDKCMLIIRSVFFNDQGITVEELKEMNTQYQVITKNITITIFLLFGKIAKYLIFPFMPGYWRVMDSNKRIEDILFNVVNRHKRNYDETQTLDIIDSYIKERDERRRKGDPTAEYFTDKALVSTLHQFVNDGVVFVGLFIGNFLTSLVEHPEEQEKIYQELMEVVGPERLPTMEDKSKLSFTNAFMYEVIRKTEIFPLFPSLQCTKETTIQGSTIPEGSITLVNSYAANHNPNTYDDPETFNPSRFLSSPDKPRPELPTLFGVGKRSCIGEGFTMIQALLFFTTIVKNFRLTFPEGAQEPTSVYWSQEKALICAVPRSQK